MQSSSQVRKVINMTKSWMSIRPWYYFKPIHSYIVPMLFNVVPIVFVISFQTALVSDHYPVEMQIVSKGKNRSLVEKW